MARLPAITRLIREVHTNTVAVAVAAAVDVAVVVAMAVVVDVAVVWLWSLLVAAECGWDVPYTGGLLCPRLRCDAPTWFAPTALEAADIPQARGRATHHPQ